MSIKKFERDMLYGGDIHVNRKYVDVSYDIHWHDYFEIIFYKNCKGKCLLNTEEYPLKDSSVFFLAPGDFHRIDTLPNENSFSTVISFSENMIDPKLSALKPLTSRVLYSPSDLTVSAIYELYDSFKSENPLKKIGMYHLLNLILIELSEKGEMVKTKNSYIHPGIGKAMLYILADPSKDITLPEIAKICGMSPAYFSHIFHTQNGKPFKKWLNDIRIDHACRLLEQSEQSVLNICYASGFHNLSHFGKCFKESTGMTPREYKKCKNRHDKKS